MPAIDPCANSFLIGHDNAERMFLKAWQSGSLHNSWLIGGIEGIGKATFAYRAARFLLAADHTRRDSYRSMDIPETNDVFRLVAGRAHPDLKILERDFIETDKKKVIKALRDGDPLDETQLQGLKKSSVIKIDEVRTVNEFMSKKSFEGNWRIVIIDSVDDLNVNSANALLKVLEEPPAKSLLFLISHNPSRLLPTIRSRCAKLNLQPLDKNNTASLLRRYAPELSETEIKGLVDICGGSIGRALNYASKNALLLWKRLEDLLYAGKRFDISNALKLCDEAAKDEDLWALVFELITRFVSDNLKSGQNIKELGSAWDKSVKMWRDQTALNMDKKNTLLMIIKTIGEALEC